MSTESSIEMIPLSQLVAGEEVNVRKTDREEGVKALAKSILAHGLIHPLEVRLTPEGRYEVVDGNRRLAAIRKNAGKKDIQVMCRLVQSGDTEARERSLAANVMRVNLHPVDEYEAYAGLVQLGLTEAQIADRYGVTALDVKKRLRLAGLAVAVRTAWRDGKIDGEQARAFAVSSDTVEQSELLKRVLKSKNEWDRNAGAIRRELTQTFLKCDHPDVIFIGGVDVYTAAGGRIERDLFSGKDEEMLIDRPIVDRLVEEKLRAEADRLTAEGWGWVKLESEIEADDGRWDWPEAELLPHATEDERKALAKPTYNTDHREAATAILGRLKADPAFRSGHGLLISCNWSGLRIEGPYTRASGLTDEERAEREAARKAAESASSEEDKASLEPEGPQTPWTVREALSLSLTQVASQMLSERWHQALVAMTATLRVRLRHYGATPLRIDPDHKRVGQLQPERSNDRLDWGDAYADLWKTPIAEVEKEFAGYVGSLLDLIDRKLDDRSHQGFDLRSVRDELVATLPPDEFNRRLGEAFDAAAYFAKVPVPLIDSALIEMTGFPSRTAQKKAEKAQYAAGIATTKGWLPPELRTLHYVPVTPEHHKDAAE
jgi:ParB family transcriptional regulator, chromosome partitioning protein